VIVVDVNVVAYYFIEGEKTALARELMRRDPDWRLPALWRHEYLNVLATYTRRGGASVEEARVLWRRALELMGPREEPGDAEAALALAVTHPVSACDGQYIALAQRLQSAFVTEDRRLLKAFPSLARTMQAFVGR
jgi:predicted nucleic acid-binding protein